MMKPLIEKFQIMRSYVAKRISLVRLRSHKDVKRRQDRLLKSLMAHAARSFSYYAPYADVPFAQWPIANKSIMLENFSGMNEIGLSRDAAWTAAEQGLKAQNSSGRVGRYTIGTSTGTSGQRGLLMMSDQERCMWLGSILARCLLDFPLQRHRIALLLATGNELYETSNRSRRLVFSFFDLRKGLSVHGPALEQFDPDVLIGSPHALASLAHQKLASRPKHIFTGGEVLDDLDAMIIQSWFGVRPRSIYQATEGFLGVACEHGTIHLNEDDMLFEEEPVPGCADAFIPIITDLRRRSQAMIRYRLNDVLVKRREPCSCGSALMGLARIEGRQDDVIHLPSDDGIIVAIVPEALRVAILDAHRDIQDFRLVQTGEIALLLTLDEEATDQMFDAATTSLRGLLSGMNISRHVKIETHRGIAHGFDQKLRRISVVQIQNS